MCATETGKSRDLWPAVRVINSKSGKLPRDQGREPGKGTDSLLERERSLGCGFCSRI